MYLSLSLSFSPSIYLSIYISIYLSIYLSIYEEDFIVIHEVRNKKKLKPDLLRISSGLSSIHVCLFRARTSSTNLVFTHLKLESKQTDNKTNRLTNRHAHKIFGAHDNTDNRWANKNTFDNDTKKWKKIKKNFIPFLLQ